MFHFVPDSLGNKVVFYYFCCLLLERYFFTASNHIGKESKKTAFTNFCPLKRIESYPLPVAVGDVLMRILSTSSTLYTVIDFVQYTLYSFLLGLYSKYTRIQPMGVVCQRRQTKNPIFSLVRFPGF
jgi:hypothetical protein